LTPPLVLEVAKRGTGATMMLLRYEFGFTWHHQYGDTGTALHHAAAAGNLEVLDLLSAYPEESSIDLGSVSTGKTALHSAASSGQTEACTRLIGAGADVNRADKQGKTPLHLACAQQHVLVAQKLLHCGATPDVVDIQGRAPWSSAIDACNFDILRIVYTRSTTTYSSPAQYATGSKLLDDSQTLAVLSVLETLGEPLAIVTTVGVDLATIAERKEKPLSAAFIRDRVQHTAPVPVPFRR
jgi:hypothetical protein